MPGEVRGEGGLQCAQAGRGRRAAQDRGSPCWETVVGRRRLQESHGDFEEMTISPLLLLLLRMAVCLSSGCAEGIVGAPSNDVNNGFREPAASRVALDELRCPVIP